MIKVPEHEEANKDVLIKQSSSFTWGEIVLSLLFIALIPIYIVIEYPGVFRAAELIVNIVRYFKCHGFIRGIQKFSDDVRTHWRRDVLIFFILFFSMLLCFLLCILRDYFYSVCRASVCRDLKVMGSRSVEAEPSKEIGSITD